MAYLLLMVVFVAIGLALVWMKDRRPLRTDDSVAEFRRSLQALAPPETDVADEEDRSAS